MYQRVTLDNGVQILTEDVPHVRSVAIGIWVNTGSRYESQEMAGISHFIEHLMFKGTKSRTARQIAEALDAVGGQLNAFTAKEFTCYYARVMDEHFDLALDVLFDMLYNSCFDLKDIEKEKNVVIEEIKMYEDTPDELVHDVFATTIWQGHALGRPVLGNPEIVSSFSRDQIISYYQANYTPENLVVAVAGNISHDEVIEKLGKVFIHFKGRTPLREKALPVPNSSIICKQKETEQVHLCIGAPGLPMNHEQVYTFQVINTILGDGLSSRLFQEIRENRGLAYSIYSYHSSYHDAGLFCIYAGLSKRNVGSVTELIFKEINDIQNNGIKEEELHRAKSQIKGNLFLSLENVTTRMSRLAKFQIYLGKVIPPEEVVEKVNQVTKERVINLVREVFVPGAFVIATVGPWDNCQILKRTVGKFLS